MVATATASGLMTAEEFYVWAELPENADVWYELEDGRPAECQSAGVLHGTVCWLVTVAVGQYFKSRGGYLSLRCGLLLRRDPDTVLGPDVVAFSTRPAFEDLPRGPATDIPTLVVEVLSPSDRPGKTDRRVKSYLKRGIPLVWTVDPEDRTVAVYTQSDSVVLEIDEVLLGEPELPGFACKVSAFFSWPEPPPAAQ